MGPEPPASFKFEGSFAHSAMKITPSSGLVAGFLDEALGDAFPNIPRVSEVLALLLTGQATQEHPSPLRTFDEATEVAASQRTYYREVHALAGAIHGQYPHIVGRLQGDRHLAMRKNGVLILDEHILPHTSPKMEGVAFFHSTTTGQPELGLSMLSTHYYHAGTEYPVGFAFYRRQEELALRGKDAEFQEKNPIGRALLERAFQNPNAPDQVVLDAYFMTKENAGWLRHLKKIYVSRPKRSWNCTCEGKRQSMTDLYASIPPAEFTPVHVRNRKTGRVKTYRVAVRDAYVPRIGKQRLVFINHDPAPEASDDWECRDPFEEVPGGRKFRVFVTNALDWTAQQILELYALRWAIETSYRDLSQHLGLHGCKWRTLEGQYCFIALAFLCYLLLMWAKKHDSLARYGPSPESLGELRQAFVHYSQDEFNKYLAEIKDKCQTCPVANWIHEHLYGGSP